MPVEGVLAEVEQAAPRPAPRLPRTASRRLAGRRGGAAGQGSRVRHPAPQQRRSPRPRHGASRANAESSSHRCRDRAPAAAIVARDIASAPAAGGDRLRAAVARNIVASWQQIPHVHIGGELAADGLVRARASAAPDRAAVTVTDLLVVALARALAEVPELNAVLGARTAPSSRTERGRPLARRRHPLRRRRPGAPRRRLAALAEVARERRRLVEAARAGALDRRDLAGGTCTLSNLGAYPVDFFAPVVSGPQVAMVATGRDRGTAGRGRRDGSPSAPDDVGERRDRPPRRRRRGGRSPARRIRTADRAARQEAPHDHRPGARRRGRTRRPAGRSPTTPCSPSTARWCASARSRRRWSTPSGRA